MIHFFVNLPLRYIHADKKYIDYFIEHRLQPELGLDVIALETLDLAWHRAIAGVLRDAGLACAIHLPFFDLQPGSIDDGILDATRRRLAGACAIARIYQPRHLVAHAGFTDIYEEFYSQWLERCCATWHAFMRDWPDHPPVFLENVYEENPQPLGDLLDRIAADRMGVCFDTGHWHSFSQGAHLKNLRQWLTGLALHLRHLHLHDNDGGFDQHRGLGQGLIPWEEFFTTLLELRLRPSITLEPHSQAAIEHSLSFISEHQDWFNQ